MHTPSAPSFPPSQGTQPEDLDDQGAVYTVGLWAAKEEKPQGQPKQPFHGAG